MLMGFVSPFITLYVALFGGGDCVRSCGATVSIMFVWIHTELWATTLALI